MLRVQYSTDMSEILRIQTDVFRPELIGAQFSEAGEHLGLIFVGAVIFLCQPIAAFHIGLLSGVLHHSRGSTDKRQVVDGQRPSDRRNGQISNQTGANFVSAQCYFVLVPTEMADFLGNEVDRLDKICKHYGNIS